MTSYISVIEDKAEKRMIARAILEALPEWFGIPEAREKYIADCSDQIMLVAKQDDSILGFLCPAETGKDTVELVVTGVLKEFHRQGIGSALLTRAKKIAKEKGYSFLQVKTVQMGKYEEYDQTNRFYLSQGFKEFEIFPTLWDEWNPCQIYIMAL